MKMNKAKITLINIRIYRIIINILNKKKLKGEYNSTIQELYVKFFRKKRNLSKFKSKFFKDLKKKFFYKRERDEP